MNHVTIYQSEPIALGKAGAKKFTRGRKSYYLLSMYYLLPLCKLFSVSSEPQHIPMRYKEEIEVETDYHTVRGSHCDLLDSMIFFSVLMNSFLYFLVH